MATVTPEIAPQETKKAPVILTPKAVVKVKEIMSQQTPAPAGLRVGVVGGGCSGVSYAKSFEHAAGLVGKVVDVEGVKVYVDATSITYLSDGTVDYRGAPDGAIF